MMIHRRNRKSKFQERLEEVAKVYRENLEDPTASSASLSAQPPNPVGDFNWRHVNDELPQYYSPIHIWDGKTMYLNWARVWSEATLGDIYVNNIDDRVITKITHWTPPKGQKYPKYEPLTDDDIKRYTKRDIKLIIKALTKLILLRENSKHPSVEYVQGVDDAIITIEKLIKPKRMTGKHRGG